MDARFLDRPRCVAGALTLSPVWFTVGFIDIVLSVAIQGRGHRLEPVPAEAVYFARAART